MRAVQPVVVSVVQAAWAAVVSVAQQAARVLERVSSAEQAVQVVAWSAVVGPVEAASAAEQADERVEPQALPVDPRPAARTAFEGPRRASHIRRP